LKYLQTFSPKNVAEVYRILNGIDKLLWSVAIPGFGQFLNRHYIKGIVLLALEFIVNVKSHLNLIIMASFLGDNRQAIAVADYQWLMFYPCLYMFGMWDAYRYGGKPKSSWTSIPFVLAAYFATVGVIYSSVFQINGVVLGPVWLPMLFCFIGLGTGFALLKIIKPLTA
jgi:hypothetical protein